MKIVVLLGLMLAFTGCVEKLNGELTVFRPLALNQDGGVLEVPAGQMNAELRLKNKKKFELVFVDSAGEKTKAKFKLTRPITLPRSGVVRVSPAEWGQPYSIEGISNTQIHRSPRQHRTERCQERRRIEECYYDQDGRRICRTREIVYEGYREVEYYLEQADQVLSLAIMGEGVLPYGAFVATRSDTHTVYTYRGPCRLY